MPPEQFEVMGWHWGGRTAQDAKKEGRGRVSTRVNSEPDSAEGVWRWGAQG